MSKKIGKYKSIIDLLVMTNKSYLLSSMNKLLSDAWNDDPNYFLKLVCLIRDPRNGLGKRGFSFYMLQFLKDNFPKTYEKNIKKIAMEYGCLKDLLLMSKYKMRDDFDDIELKIYAEILRSDLNTSNISLAVKWAPRERNQYHYLALKISKIMFPNEKKSLELYRKQILNPLSCKMKTVEQYMSNNDWNKINYDKVPVGAIKKYGKHHINNNSNDMQLHGAFLRHDKERYMAYRESKKYGISDNKISKRKIELELEAMIIELELFGTNLNIENKIISILDRYDVLVDGEELETKLDYELIDEYTIDNELDDNVDDVNEEFYDSDEENRKNILDFCDASTITKINDYKNDDDDDDDEWDIM
jgi:hypothetical protein